MFCGTSADGFRMSDSRVNDSLGDFTGSLFSGEGWTSEVISDCLTLAVSSSLSVLSAIDATLSVFGPAVSVSFLAIARSPVGDLSSGA